jgi:hypothetical protein
MDSEFKSISKYKSSHPNLYGLIEKSLVNASKLHNTKAIPSKQQKHFSMFNQSDNLQLALVSTKSKKIGGSYLPYGKICLNNINDSKIKKDSTYKNAVAFIVAHELGHALGMHTTEDETAIEMALEGNVDLLDMGMQIVIEQTYGSLNSYTQKQLDTNAINIMPILGITQRNLDAEMIAAQSSNDSLVGGLANMLSSKKKQKRIPVTTSCVIKKIIDSGTDFTGASNLMQTGIKSIEAASVMQTHSKKFEFEADEIGKKITIDSGYSIEGACWRLSQYNPKKEFTGHPHPKDRMEKLGCKA